MNWFKDTKIRVAIGVLALVLIERLGDDVAFMLGVLAEAISDGLIF